MTRSQDDKVQETVYEFRTNSIELKDTWCRLSTWMMQGAQQLAVGSEDRTPLPPLELRELPAPDLRPEDAKRCVNNPALIDIPFRRARELIYNLARFKCLGLEALLHSADQMLYALFQLEVYALKKPKSGVFHQQVRTTPADPTALLPARAERRMCHWHAKDGRNDLRTVCVLAAAA